MFETKCRLKITHLKWGCVHLTPKPYLSSSHLANPSLLNVVIVVILHTIFWVYDTKFSLINIHSNHECISQPTFSIHWHTKLKKLTPKRNACYLRQYDNLLRDNTSFRHIILCWYAQGNMKTWKHVLSIFRNKGKYTKVNS